METKKELLFLPPSHLSPKLSKINFPIRPTHAIHLPSNSLCEILSVSEEAVELLQFKNPITSKIENENGCWYDCLEVSKSYALDLHDMLKMVGKVEIRMAKDEGNIDIGLNLIDLNVNK